jgi:hypothetical protein
MLTQKNTKFDTKQLQLNKLPKLQQYVNYNNKKTSAATQTISATN